MKCKPATVAADQFTYLSSWALNPMSCAAKGLGNGLPIGVCMAKGVAANGRAITAPPMAATRSAVRLQPLAEDGVMQQAANIREALVSALQANLCDAKLISEVRGTDS